jgi:hypothetical protein
MSFGRVHIEFVPFLQAAFEAMVQHHEFVGLLEDLKASERKTLEEVLFPSFFIAIIS